MNYFSSRPKVTVIGCGHWGKNIIRNLASMGALGAVADQDSARAEELAKNYNVPAVSLDVAMNDPAHPALAMVTPVITHTDMVGRALAAGKDVYVEKPLALTRSDAEDLLATARVNKRVLMVGHLLRYHPGFMKLIEQVKAGAIGKVHYIAAHRLHYWPMHPEEDVVADLAPHDLAMIDGITECLPDLSDGKFHVRGHSFLQPPHADIAQVQLQYGDIAAHLYLSRLNPYKEHRFTLLGETGALVFDDAKPWDEKLVLSRPSGQTIHQAIALEMDEPLGREMRHFISCLETRAEPLTGGTHALRVCTVLEALLK
jgi:predicted dehydrogenase